MSDLLRTRALPMKVLITSDGGVLVDGAPVRVPAGEPVLVFVLGTMRRRALAAGGPVAASIVDRQAEYASHVEVTADGACRIVRHESSREVPGAEPPSGPGPSPAGSGWPADIPASPSPSVPVPMPVPVPDALAELVARIRVAIDTGALERAAALAFRLLEHTTRTYGDTHPYTLEARALDAFTTYRCGDYTAAGARCLELAETRRQLDDPRAHEELLRAVALWRLIDDPSSAVDHGRAVLATWSRLAAERGSTATAPNS
ncbi:hypothetical protein [Streptomyces ziwulingensis]|uniref:Tetratricopeptide repeat protein n=1 Tax=Streptomyces ziwulingensis TaxID=1045501 RepID=A0ABP9B022_9ACTN